MSIFDRRISAEFLDKLRETKLWQLIAHGMDLFWAIRRESVNVYYQGCSLFRIFYRDQKIGCETHYKYLLRPRRKPPYVRWSLDAGGLDEKRKEQLRVTAFTDKIDENLLNDLKDAAKPYAGAEKRGVHELLRANENVIDVEVAMTASTAKAEAADIDPEYRESGPVALRIDFAVLKEQPGDPSVTELVFFEAKLHSNKELRAADEGIPRVVKQVRAYKKLIDEYRGDILQCYPAILRSHLKLDLANRLFGGPQSRLRVIVEEIADKARTLEVSRDFRLIVFGYDQDQIREGGVFWGHLKRLTQRDMIGEEERKLLFFVGDPSGYTTGIEYLAR